MVRRSVDRDGLHARPRAKRRRTAVSQPVSGALSAQRLIVVAPATDQAVREGTGSNEAGSVGIGTRGYGSRHISDPAMRMAPPQDVERPEEADRNRGSRLGDEVDDYLVGPTDGGRACHHRLFPPTWVHDPLFTSCRAFLAMPNGIVVAGLLVDDTVVGRVVDGAEGELVTPFDEQPASPP